MSSIEIILLITICVGAYFLGGLNFARIISNFRKDDITIHGSGNPGTMNMVRNHGLILGIFTLVLDALKGVIPTLIVYFIFGASIMSVGTLMPMTLVGLSAVIGHIYPVIYKFKGGKGVATTFGVFSVINPLASLSLFLLGVLMWVTIRIGSLCSLVYTLLFAVWLTIKYFELKYIGFLMLIYLIVALIYYAHQTNIKKLLKGKESKIDFQQTFKKDKQLIEDIKKKQKNDDLK